MAKKKNLLQLVTANRLHDGLVVFFDDQLRWTENIDQARLVQTKEEGELLLTKGREAVSHDIVEPYLIDVELENSRVIPIRYREKLRGLGPSVRLDLGRQAEPVSDRLGAVHV